jgi:hypothetical protein
MEHGIKKQAPRNVHTNAKFKPWSMKRQQSIMTIKKRRQPIKSGLT